MLRDYYQILGVPHDASIEAIKEAYRRKAVDCHPDRGGSNHEMALVNKAWDILSDPRLRSRYDQARADRESHSEEPEAASARQRTPHGWFYEFWRRDFLNAEFIRDSSALVPWAGESFSGNFFLVIGVCVGLWGFRQVLPISPEWAEAHPYWKWVIGGLVTFVSAEFGTCLHRTVTRNLGFFEKPSI